GSAELEAKIADDVRNLDSVLRNEMNALKTENDELAAKTTGNLTDQIGAIYKELASRFDSDILNMKEYVSERTETTKSDLESQIARTTEDIVEEANNRRLEVTRAAEAAIGDFNERLKEEKLELTRKLEAMEAAARESIDEVKLAFAPRSDVAAEIDVMRKEIKAAADAMLSEAIAKAEESRSSLDESLSSVRNEYSSLIRDINNELKESVGNLTGETASIKKELEERITKALKDISKSMEAVEGKIPDIEPEQIKRELKEAVDEVREKMKREVEQRIGALPTKDEIESIRNDFRQEIAMKSQESWEELEAGIEKIKKAIPYEEIERKINKITEELDDRALDGSFFAQAGADVRDRLMELEQKFLKMTSPPDFKEARKSIVDEVVSKFADITKGGNFADAISEALEKVKSKFESDAGELERKITERIAAVREELFDEIAEQAAQPSAIQLQPEATETLADRIDMNAIRERLTREISESLKDRGLFKMMFDPASLAQSVERDIPDHATEEQVISIIGGETGRKMLGKRCGRDIVTEDDYCVVRKGEEITPEVIRRAKDYGRFIELSLAIDTDDESK
ncbi:MAG TPA: hypothetical protein PLQ76_01035, partial [bacterium]|nr:hypothetical protein [bacterium]